jgi:hypothetical protein
VNNPLVFNQFLRLLLRNWKPFVLVLVPAVLLVWLVLPAAVASVIFGLALVSAAVWLIGGFFLGLRRGWTRQR